MCVALLQLVSKLAQREHYLKLKPLLSVANLVSTRLNFAKIVLSFSPRSQCADNRAIFAVISQCADNRAIFAVISEINGFWRDGDTRYAKDWRLESDCNTKAMSKYASIQHVVKIVKTAPYTGINFTLCSFSLQRTSLQLTKRIQRYASVQYIVFIPFESLLVRSNF